MEIISKRTTELSYDDIQGIFSLFKDVFSSPINEQIFKDEFLNTAKGYSYHALAIENGKIVGHNAYVPFDYESENEQFLVALSVEAMVDKSCRGRGVYKQLLNILDEEASKDGCMVRMGYPNDNSYPIQINGFKMSKLGQLSIYALPVHMGLVSKKLMIGSLFSIPLSYLLSKLSLLSNNCKKVYNPYFRSDRDRFNSYRYNWFGGNYTKVSLDEGDFVYRIAEFKGVNAMFLIDVFPLSKALFDKAVRYIYKKEYKNISIVLYVGNLPFKPLSMIKIPKRFEPKKFNVMAKTYNGKDFGEKFYDIGNWALNLSNTDLI